MEVCQGKATVLTVRDAARETRRRGSVPRSLVIALVIVAIVFIVRALGPQTIGEQARREVQRKLSEHYRGLKVSIRRGHYEHNVGLILEDVRFRDPRGGSSSFASRDLVRIERIFVLADIAPEKLLDKYSPIVTRRIVLDGVTANAWMGADGQVSLAALMPLPKFGPVCPKIELRDVNLRLIDLARPSRRPIDVDVAEAVLNNITCSGGTIRKSLTLKGSSEYFSSFWLRADMLDDAFQVRGAVSGARFSKELFERCPDSLKQKIGAVRELDLLCDASFAAVRPTSDTEIEYACRTTVHEGRFSHPGLPMPLTGIRGVFSLNPHGVEIEASQAVLGDAVCRASGTIAGHSWPSDLNLAVSANGLWLDSRLAASLPDKVRDAWDKLRPVGRVDIDAQVSHSSSNWRSDATVLCNGIDVSFEAFPYPVQQMVGRIEVRDSIARGESLTGRAGGQRLQCSFQLPLDRRLGPRKTFSIGVEGSIPIDSTLLDSLSPRGMNDSPLESFVRSLQPRGSMQLARAVLSTDANGNPHREIDLRIADGHLRYDKFAYPLYNVTGQVNVDDSLVHLVGFTAANANAGIVQCDGTYRISTAIEPMSELALRFLATDVPMDESLRSSLPPSTLPTWDALSPSGVLDELAVILTQHGRDAPLGLDITAEQHKSESLTNRTLSLRPVAIPYRLDIAEGAVHYDGSKVEIHSLDGRHDFSRLTADGVCQQTANGQWLLDLDVHSGSRFNLDAELIASLPQQMSESMRRLQLRGPVSVNGNTKLLLPTDRRPEPAIDWKLMLQLEGNRIADVGPVHGLRGEIWIDGHRDENGLFAAGNVRLDSMHVNDLQITGIRGPYVIDGDRLRLGSLANARLPKQAAAFPSLATNVPGIDDLTRSGDDTESTSIQGKLFGGTIEMDGEVELTTSDFDVSVAVNGAELPTILAELGQAGNDYTGSISGQARFDGKIGAGDLLKGNGAGRLSGANVYQLPFVVQLLNQLRIAASPDVAFTDGEVEFSVFGDSITLSRLQLWGDLVALDGGGTLNRRRELDLSFNTRVSPHNTFTRVFAPLGSQRYTLWTIDVTGPIDAPTIQRRALDGVGQTLDDVGQTIGRLFPPVVPEAEQTKPKSWFK